MRRYGDPGSWWTGPEELPLGRGINFEIELEEIDPVLSKLKAVDWPLFIEPHEAEYKVKNQMFRQKQFLVQDPDGYLLRFSETVAVA